MYIEKNKYFGNKILQYESRINRNLLWSTFKNIEKKNVLQLLSANKNDFILDVGSGPGIYAKLLKDIGFKLLCIDSSISMIKAVKQKGILGIVANAENFALNNTFDKIICLGVLEFVDNPVLVIRQLKTHLKKDGCIVLIIPKKSIPGILYKCAHLFHKLKVRLFSIKEITTLLSNCNMRLTASKVLLDFACVIKAEPTPI